MRLTFELQDDRFRADMEAVGGLMWQGFRKGLKQAGEIALAYIRDAAPIRKGGLRDSLYYRIMPGGDVVRFFADRSKAPYAMAVDEGVEHTWVIEGNPLRFVINGHPVFAQNVVHPAMEGKHFTRRGLERARPEMMRVLKDAIIAEATSGRVEGGFVKRKSE